MLELLCLGSPRAIFYLLCTHANSNLYLFTNTNFPPTSDLFAERPYATTMENLCPWLLRYYTAAVILSPSRRRTMLKDLLREIQDFSYLYSDPITQFLESLYKEFDFDEAQIKLAECQELLKRDYFLRSFLEKFTHEARVLICEMYCTISRRVDLTMLATKLQLTVEEAEKWMVNMIRGSAVGNGIPLDAKIDSSGKQVLMSVPSKTSQQVVVEKTRDLTHRTGILSAAIEAVIRDDADYLRVR
jgi:translation initiation factor 3 subunit E